MIDTPNNSSTDFEPESMAARTAGMTQLEKEHFYWNEGKGGMMNEEEIARLIAETGWKKSNILLDRDARGCRGKCGKYFLKRSSRSSHHSRKSCPQLREPDLIRQELIRYSPNPTLINMVFRHNLTSLESLAKSVLEESYKNSVTKLKLQGQVLERCIYVQDCVYDENSATITREDDSNESSEDEMD